MAVLTTCIQNLPTLMLFFQLLSVQQLYRICTTYWDEDYNTSTVSEEVSTLDTKVVLLSSCFGPYDQPLIVLETVLV